MDNSIVNSVNSLENIGNLTNILLNLDDKANRSIFSQNNLNGADEFFGQSMINNNLINNVCLTIFSQGIGDVISANQFENLKPIQENYTNSNDQNKNNHIKKSYKEVKAFIPKIHRHNIPKEEFVAIIGLKRAIHKDKNKLNLILRQKFKQSKIKDISIIDKDPDFYGTQIFFENDDYLIEFMKQRSFLIPMDNVDVYFNIKPNKEGNRYYVTYK